ncbi:hypothetical protein JQS43_24400 [Natronosporangium hydrolyticum]|uniref:DUF2637 domain-containing protein n=1 Tax=Natronosporangium hydrolyticum TaxID=2811111 RepID=A0A895YJ07_9ACTN|nr:hypothetical protein [Natronosporangium hydrolyticum]QSB14576.1 hypothetical protein JQS43_24400 [Natronosporangium hydrolyticum]
MTEESTTQGAAAAGTLSTEAIHRLAFTFYATAAAAAVIGQTWVALKKLPWSDDLHVGWRIGAVAPFALTLELLAVVLAVMADHRMRLGERAVVLRVFSAAVAVLATGVIVVGHWGDPYVVAAFGGLSVAAYLLSMAHMAMRRRDAMRAAGQLAQIAPAYGWWRRLRRPLLTARAAELARERGLGLYESLRAAELELRAERRRPAIAAAVGAAIRAEQADPRMAEIAVSTLDLDRIAAELAGRADYAGWAARLAPAVTAPVDTATDESPSMPDAPPVGESPLYVPDEWMSHPTSGESPEPGQSPPHAIPPGDAPAGKASARRQRRPQPAASGDPEVTDSLLAQAKTVSDDSDTRMAWLWHATSGQASGRQLAAVGGVSAATGIRRAAQWRLTPPPDPRGDTPPVPVA